MRRKEQATGCHQCTTNSPPHLNTSTAQRTSCKTHQMLPSYQRCTRCNVLAAQVPAQPRASSEQIEALSGQAHTARHAISWQPPAFLLGQQQSHTRKTHCSQ